jgi:hypothetical protein
MTGSGAFTANGQFVTGSALAFGQATQIVPDSRRRLDVARVSAQRARVERA